MELQSVIYREYGHPHEVLTMEPRKLVRPDQGEILVRMIARPINPSDLIPITGAYAHRISLPAVPGYEGVGVVEAVGPGVSNELIGRRVLPLRGEGTWQEVVKAPADFVIPVPQDIDDDTAAQLYINPVTAWIVCTETLRLKPGDTLLINAGGSAIGRILAQLSVLLGFRLIAVTRNDRYKAELENLGASLVVNAAEDGINLREAVMSATSGVGATAAIDSVGGLDGAMLAECVRPRDVVLSLGLLSGIPVDWERVRRKTGADIRLFHLRHWNAQVSVGAWQGTFDRIMALVTEKKIKLMPPRARYPLSKVREAVLSAQSETLNEGKVFLVNGKSSVLHA